MERRILLSVVVATTAILLISGCTPTAKKARYAERAERYFKAGDYDKAKIEYLSVLKIDQRDANAYARMGAMWFDEGVPLRAAPFLLKARELNPKDLSSRVNLALLYLQMGRLEDAWKEASALLEAAPDNDQALLLLAETSATPEQYAKVEEQLQKFPNRESAYLEVVNGVLALRKPDFAKA